MTSNYQATSMAPRDESASGSDSVRGDNTPNHHGIADEDGADTHESHDGQIQPPRQKGRQDTSAQSFTPRSLLVGLAIGTLITFSNTYFGLQTGWISSMAMPSSLIGFAVFKSMSRFLSFPFSPIENVLIQTVAGAVGTMPLGCGFVGVIPALEYLLRDGPDGPRGIDGDDGQGEGGPLKLGLGKLIIWSLGVCLFGVVFAVPLRKEVIVREKLKFPSGTATALMIRVFHGENNTDEKKKKDNPESSDEETQGLLARENREENIEPSPRGGDDARNDWKANIRLLTLAFSVSALYTLLSYFIPQLRDLPIFGFTLAGNWLWTLNPSPAYIGQGIIMGPSTSLHMLVGAIIGWGFLSPLAKTQGWAPGPVDNWENGSKGWIVWVSLAIMLADSIISLSWLLIRPLVNYGPGLLRQVHYNAKREEFWRNFSWKTSISRQGYVPVEQNDGTSLSPNHNPDVDDEADEDAPPSELISTRTVLILLPATLVLNVVCMHISFGNLITPFLSVLATIVALLLSIMGVRAQGETDLNPVSGISKLTQLIFALVTPASTHTRRSAVVTNLLAGAVSESGALQAGDMMQDLKTGHLVGASPKAQFYGQVIGSLYGAVISALVYRLYVSVYPVPGPMFEIPTAYVWIFTARLVTGQGLPEMAWPIAGIASVLFAFATVFRIYGAATGYTGGRSKSAPWRAWIPGGIAVAVGMYNVPSFTLARAIGGVIVLWWGWRQKRVQKRMQKANGHGSPESSVARSDSASRDDMAVRTKQHEDRTASTIVVLASGLILGEGVVSIINLGLASAGVHHL